MTLEPQVMAAVGNITAFATCGILLLIITMTFQAKVKEAVHNSLYNYKLVSLCPRVCVCVSTCVCVYDSSERVLFSGLQ